MRALLLVAACLVGAACKDTSPAPQGNDLSAVATMACDRTFEGRACAGEGATCRAACSQCGAGLYTPDGDACVCQSGVWRCTHTDCFPPACDPPALFSDAQCTQRVSCTLVDGGGRD